MERYIGKILDNRYEILEVIGTGGMAVVFKAKCHRLNRLVAIKMLKKDLSEDAVFRRQFHDESQAVAMLSHPNIMAVYDVSRGGEMDYIVMELIDGITLKQYMERRGKLNWPESLHFITQIMKGLSHAHSRGIIHRDIKPQNIMVLRDGTVKVTDFGIACLSNGPKPSNEAIGSVHYISPEQAKGDHTDNRSDIYSAGVVLYEMLTTRLPFEGSDPVAVAIQHFSAVPLSPREINPDIPEALEQICVKAMAADRNKRYSTADEMLQDLEAFRKDPNINFDYSIEDLRPEQNNVNVEDEPTQPIPNMGVARTKQQYHNPPSRDDEDDYEYEKPKSNWWKIVLMILIVSAIGYFGVTRLYQGIMDSFTPVEIPEYTVPSVVGLTVEEAEAMEAVFGSFNIVVDTEGSTFSTEYPEGHIIHQTPEAEKKGKNSSGDPVTITVKLSLGARSGEMLYLIGEDARSAKLRLEQTKGLTELHLNVIISDEEEYHDEIEAGHVIRTSPAAGTALSEGDDITLTVSKGPEPKYSTMKYCINQDIETVRRDMENLNLIADFQKVEGAKPAGTILSQSIDTGTEVLQGTTVTFTYSDGEKLIDLPVIFTTPAGEKSAEGEEGGESGESGESEEENNVEMRVQIFLDSNSVYDQMLPGEYTLQETISAKAGSYQLRIYVDGIQWRDETVTFTADE